MPADNVNPAIARIRGERGLAVKIGKLLGISRQGVWMWKNVPPNHAAAVARFLRMPRHVVCPEVFPAPKRVRRRRNSTRN